MKKYFVLKPEKLIKEFHVSEFDDYSDEYYGESYSDIIFKLIEEEFYEKLGLNEFKKIFRFYISEEESSCIRFYDVRTMLNINEKYIEICK